MSLDPIELAEAEVVRHKADVAAELQLLSAKAHRIVISPRFLTGILVGSIVLAYLATGRSRDKKREKSSHPGTLSLALQTAHLLMPLIRTIRGPRRITRPAPTPLLPNSRESERRLETDRE